MVGGSPAIRRGVDARSAGDLRRGGRRPFVHRCDEVASAIADALAAERDDAPRPQPTDPLAIELYFRARQAIVNFWQPYQAAIAGNHALALELVGVAVDAGLIDLAWISRLQLFDPPRGDPTFEARQRTVEQRAGAVVSAWRAAPESLDEALASLHPSE